MQKGEVWRFEQGWYQKVGQPRKASPESGDSAKEYGVHSLSQARRRKWRGGPPVQNANLGWGKEGQHFWTSFWDPCPALTFNLRSHVVGRHQPSYRWGN